jgi:hypothetical protein
MKEHLHQIVTGISATSVNVEAGHFYSDLQLREIDVMGIRIGNNVVSLMQELGLHVGRCVLVDDFHAEDIYTTSNLQQMAGHGFLPDVVYMEGSFQDQARSLLTTLEQRGHVKEKKGRKLLKADNIPMLQKENGDLSCSILDAAVYIAKHDTFGGIQVTVLPEEDEGKNYRRQQSYTKAILEKAGVSIPILDVFYDIDGTVSVDFDY